MTTALEKKSEQSLEKSPKKTSSDKSKQGGFEAHKVLIVAEKPSVARDIVKVLGGSFSDEKTHFEGDKYIVSYALGHLLTICEPNEIDEKYKSWALKTLPILPDHYPLKPIESNKKQLNALKKLIKRKDVGEVINACDAGREGELIFAYIIEYILGAKKDNKKISRLWLQSMTNTSIKEGFEKLRDDSEMENLRNAAKSRSEADWLIGINGSRGLTGYNSKFGGFFITPCGRVQTPTLSLIVSREKLINQFEPRDYSILKGHFKFGNHEYEGKWFDPKFKKEKSAVKSNDPSVKSREDWIFDTKRLSDIMAKCEKQPATIEEVTKKSTESPPGLFDLTSLQREANGKFGYSAKKTLTIAQSLYERHKVLTYPRTDSKFLPEDYTGQVEKVFNSLQKYSFSTHTEVHIKTALDKGYLVKKPQVYNDKKISDHHAIIPTGEFPKKLDDGELRIYNLVVQRLLAVFFPPANFLKTNRVSLVVGESFKTEGKVMVDMGWKIIYGKKEDDKIIEPIGEGAQVLLDRLEPESLKTKPPARYTEATLLSAMEGAGKTMEDDVLREAMKERGLGTPATRAAIIEKLVSDKYVVKEGRELLPTSKAFAVFNLIDAMHIQELSSAELTGDWEHKLSLMEEGRMERDDFMKEIQGSTVKIVDQIKNFDEEALKKEANFSPINGLKFYEYVTRYISEDKAYQIKKFIGGRRISEEELVTLVVDRKIGPFSDFRSKRGNPFAASVTLDEANKIKFVFMNSGDADEIDLTDAISIGKYHVDGSEVFKTMNEFVSDSYMAKKETGIRIGRILLGKELENAQIIKMIEGGKTDLIPGFRSTRTKRLFDAFLELDEKGAIKFSFPEKKGKKGAKPKESKDEETKEIKPTKSKTGKKTDSKKVGSKVKSLDKDLAKDLNQDLEKDLDKA